MLLLREVGPEYDYTGRMKAVKVTYITDFEQKPGYVVMGMAII